MSITFTKKGGTGIILKPVLGSVKYGDGHDIKGGGAVPYLKAGIARNGSCQVVLDDVDVTVAKVKGLISKKGSGDYTINGTSIKAGMESYDALIESVAIEGDSVLTANINWKGTIAPII